MARKTNTTVNGQPAYRVRHRIGTTLEGKPVYKNFYGAGKLEAEAKRDAYIEKTKHSRDPNVTLGALAQKYTYQILPTCDLAQSTITLYEAQYRIPHCQSSQSETSPAIRSSTLWVGNSATDRQWSNT